MNNNKQARQINKHNNTTERQPHTIVDLDLLYLILDRQRQSGRQCCQQDNGAPLKSAYCQLLNLQRKIYLTADPS